MDIVRFFDWVDHTQVCYISDVKAKLKQLNAPTHIIEHFDKLTTTKWYPLELVREFNKLVPSTVEFNQIAESLTEKVNA